MQHAEFERAYLLITTRTAALQAVMAAHEKHMEHPSPEALDFYARCANHLGDELRMLAQLHPEQRQVPPQRKRRRRHGIMTLLPDTRTA
jgi:hypothetical protein